MASMLASLGKRISREPAIRHKLNAWWLALARELVVRYGRQLSALITEVVKGWNADEVSQKIEAEIGRDLQYVRINGTFVGGMVGVLLHAATASSCHALTRCARPAATSPSACARATACARLSTASFTKMFFT